MDELCVLINNIEQNNDLDSIAGFNNIGLIGL